MRKSLVILFTLLLCVSLFAQQRTGNITGKVTDAEGNPLPGVAVTLYSAYGPPTPTVSSAEGTFRFLSLPPSTTYQVKLELAGFKTRIETGIIVAVANTTNLTLAMEMGVLEEQVTVTAVSPMVDSKKTTVGVNVTQELLQGLPTARDPWVVLQMAPSVIVDRENIGGVESGQQSNYVGRGSDTYNNNVWAMDGIVITDPAAIGASPSYYDFDAFEEMQITVGGADVSIQTGGIALNMVTRRGGNQISLGGRFYVTDQKLQADNYTEDMRAEGLAGINKINQNKDYGFNLGIPIWRDHVWFWGSYGIMDIKTATVYGTRDDTLLQNYVTKLNIQLIPENRFEAFMHVGGKLKWGRSTSAANPEGYRQFGAYYLGSPIIKFQDEHMFGDSLFVSLKYAFSDAGFNLWPMMDPEFDNPVIWDATAQRYYGSIDRYHVNRPVKQYNFLANYFNDTLLGASHDIKIGFEYANRNAYTESVYPGNMWYIRNINYPVYDTGTDELPDIPPSSTKYFGFWRGYYTDLHVDAWTGFFQDTLTFGRMNVLLGIRYDRQLPSTNDVTVYAVPPTDDPGYQAWQSFAGDEVIGAMDSLLPGLDIGAIKGVDVDGKTYMWQSFSPRLGFTFDVTGDGKTIAKLSLAQYGEFMGVGEADRWRPGGTGGWMDFVWLDGTTPGTMTLDELYWYDTSTYALYHAFEGSTFVGFTHDDAAGWFWGGYDPDDPGKTTAPYQSIQANARDVRTSEVQLSVDRELFTDFAISLVGSYRKYDNYRWGLKYFLDGETRIYDNADWYAPANPVPANVPAPGVPPSWWYWNGDTDQADEHEWYYMKGKDPVTGFDPSAYSPYSEVMKRPGYYMDYYGIDFIVNKRLSNKWMLNGNVTYQYQARHYGKQGEGYLNPTNIWAYEGTPQAAYIGGASGKINQHTYTRWMAKLGALYQLPFDINVSGTFNAREGWIITETFSIVDYTLPNPRSRSAGLMMNPFGTYRLPVFYNFTIRLEKVLRLGDTGRIYIMADLFNVLNSPIENRKYQKNHGTYYFYGEGSKSNRFVADTTDFRLNEILNPRVMRIGVRFTF